MMEDYKKGEARILTSIMWRVKGLHEYDKVMSDEAYERLVRFMNDIAPDEESREELRRIRETKASAGDRI